MSRSRIETGGKDIAIETLEAEPDQSVQPTLTIPTASSWLSREHDVRYYVEIFGKLTHNIEDGFLRFYFSNKAGGGRRDITIEKVLDATIDTDVDVSIIPPLAILTGIEIVNNDLVDRDVVFVFSGRKR